jgi:hypothetical protein
MAKFQLESWQFKKQRSQLTAMFLVEWCFRLVDKKGDRIFRILRPVILIVGANALKD